jgi:hypothetical protein
MKTSGRGGNWTDIEESQTNQIPAMEVETEPVTAERQRDGEPETAPPETSERNGS